MKKIVGTVFFFFFETINAARYQEIIQGFSANLDMEDNSLGFNKIIQLRILLFPLQTFRASFLIYESFRETYRLLVARLLSPCDFFL